MLDSKTIPVGWRKAGSVVPLIITYGIPLYILKLFLLSYVPEKLYVDEPYCAEVILLWVVLCFLSVMCFAFLTQSFFWNPGYLPHWLYFNPEAEPERLLRVYNLRLLAANKILTFEEYVEPELDSFSADDGRDIEL